MGYTDFEKCLSAVRKAKESNGKYEPYDYLT